MMFKTIHLDATLVVSCAAIAALIALMVVGSVPFSTLESHLLAYVGAGALLGIAGAVAYLILVDRVVFPALDRFLTWVERKDRARKAKRHCACCARNPEV
jgi:ABC-type proline/glycine betaine transport system permease subunit